VSFFADWILANNRSKGFLREFYFPNSVWYMIQKQFGFGSYWR
jgi:hypothetical protein